MISMVWLTSKKRRSSNNQGLVDLWLFREVEVNHRFSMIPIAWLTWLTYIVLLFHTR